MTPRQELRAALADAFGGLNVTLVVDETLDRLDLDVIRRGNAGARWVEAGPDYCTVHNGVREEDEHRCDFAEDDDRCGPDGEPRPCRLHPLVYDAASEPRIAG